MNHTGINQDGFSYADGTSEAGEAESEAIRLAGMIGDGTLTIEESVARGARGLIYAILAFRKTAASRSADIADAVTVLDVTLDAIASTVCGAVADEGAEAFA